MRYLLRINVKNKASEVEITQEEYAEFEKARNILINALEIEEKYEIMISNYLTFEKQILNITTDFMARNHIDYSNLFEVRLGLNICLVNLLTAARLYVDQLNQNVRECVPHVLNAKEIVKKFFSSEYDKNKEYRFMEALRNYVQHRGIPVHLTQQGVRSASLEGDGFLEYSIEVSSLRSNLEKDPEFKKKVLTELDEKIDLKAAIRSYIESISNIHESARSMIAESVIRARELVEDAHQRYTAIHSGSLVGLSACKWSDEGQISAIPLLLDWDDIRVRLQNRNRKLTNLRKSYVTGSIQSHSK